MAVMGGMRSFWGPLFGAAIFVVLQDFLSSRTENWMFLIGLVFVLVVRFFPRGLLGVLSRGARHDAAPVDGVSNRFGNLTAIENVSLSVAPGELRAIIGPNGAGKTTFFNLDQRPVSRRPPAGFDSMARCHGRCRRAARVGADRAHFPDHRDLSGAERRDNLRVAVELAEGMAFPLGCRARRRGRSRAARRVAGVRPISPPSGIRVGGLSHGDQRAAEIMMALALKPRLLLLDEPTAGMGDQETYDVARLMRRLHRHDGLPSC